MPGRVKASERGLAQVVDVAKAEAAVAAADDQRQLPLAAAQQAGRTRPGRRGHRRRPGRRMTTGSPCSRHCCRRNSSLLDLVAGIGKKHRRLARMLLGDIQAVVAEHQGGGDIQQPLRRLGQRAQLGGQVDRQQVDVVAAGGIVGGIGDDRGRMDDMGDPVRDGERSGIAQVAGMKMDGQPVQVVQVRRGPDQSVHLPAPGQEITAQARADETVGPGDEDLHACFLGAAPGEAVPGPQQAAGPARSPAVRPRCRVTESVT